MGRTARFLLQPQGQLDDSGAVRRPDRRPDQRRAGVSERRRQRQARRAGRAHRYAFLGARLPQAGRHRRGGSVSPCGRKCRRRVASPSAKLLPSIQSQLPSSVLLVSAYDRSQTIVGSIKDVQVTLYIAFVLVVMVIFIFLGRATDTLIPAVALPLSLLLTFIAMKLLGYSLDNLSLMALTLAIGFLVDDAIVFLENTVA